MRHRGPSLVLAMLLVVAAAVGVRVTAAGGPGAAGGPRPRVVLIGDSIVDGSRPALEAALADRYQVDTWAEPGHTFQELLPAATAVAAQRPDHVVINLGTNDVLLQRPLDETRTALRQMVDAFPPSTCVHLVTVSESFFTFSDPEVNRRSAALNAELADLARARGYPVIDWAAAARAYLAADSPDGPLTIDTVHPLEAGQRILAERYADSLPRCLPGAGGGTARPVA